MEISLADRHSDILRIQNLELFSQPVSELRQIPTLRICMSAYVRVRQSGEHKYSASDDITQDYVSPRSNRCQDLMLVAESQVII